MVMSLSPNKLKQIRAEAWKLQRETEISAQSPACLIGKMNAASQVVPPAPLFYRNLQMNLSQALEANGQNYETLLSLSQDGKEELEWWDTQMNKWNGRALLKRDFNLTIESDAYLTGWGATCMEQRTGGPWSIQEQRMYINCLELLAATLVVKTYLKEKSQIRVLLKIDNTTAVAYINHLGGTVSKQLVTLTKNLWMWCLERNIHIVAHVPGALNLSQYCSAHIHTLLTV